MKNKRKQTMVQYLRADAIPCRMKIEREANDMMYAIAIAADRIEKLEIALRKISNWKQTPAMIKHICRNALKDPYSN